MSKEFTHLDEKGNPGMVDVSAKAITHREAKASGNVFLPAELINEMKAEQFMTKKGSIVQTAVIAATMAVKNTFNTIPLCHQIPISSCKVNIENFENGFSINCTVKTQSNTGVEMEALHGVSVAALTIYDMCKAKTQNIVISDIQLEHKSGGKKDYERT